ncbi:MAG: glycosyltransferase family 39 protein [Verrucomicrobia bacterium]|nr:glycosyltransferase family 39 protein [Verrucomicrobiota bacterium]
MPLQEWIHSLEEGKGVAFVKALTFVAAFLVIAFIYDVRDFKNYSTPEAMDTAQLARNLAEGRGYTTEFIRPLSLYLLARQHGGKLDLNSPHPDLANPPAYPYLLAGLMKATTMDFRAQRGAETMVQQPEFRIAILNQGLFLVALWLVFGLAKRLFDEPVAWLATIALAGTELFWRFSISGLSTMLLVVILLVIVRCLVAAERGARESEWGYGKLLPLALLAGAFVGLGGLTRYSFAWMIVPVLVFFIANFGARRATLALVALAAFLGVMSPWLMRNYQVSGTPFGTAGYALYSDTDRFPGSRLERSLNPVNLNSPADLNKADAGEHWDKLVANTLSMMQNDLPKFGGSWLGAFFLVALMLTFQRPALVRTRSLLVISFLVLMVAQALGRTHLTAMSPDVNSENLLVILAPLAFIYGAGLFMVLLEQINLEYLQTQRLVCGIFLTILCVPLVHTLTGRVFPLAYPPYYPPVIQENAAYLEKNELMMSDMPWAVAWYGQRRCVWLALDVRKEFLALHQAHPINALYLTHLTLDNKLISQMISGTEFEWGRFAAQAAVNQEVPDGFPLKYGLATLLPEQLFLADRERWRERKRPAPPGGPAK